MRSIAQLFLMVTAINASIPPPLKDQAPVMIQALIGHMLCLRMSHSRLRNGMQMHSPLHWQCSVTQLLQIFYQKLGLEVHQVQSLTNVGVGGTCTKPYRMRQALPRGGLSWPESAILQTPASIPSYWILDGTSASTIALHQWRKLIPKPPPSHHYHAHTLAANRGSCSQGSVTLTSIIVRIFGRIIAEFLAARCARWNLRDRHC